MRTLKALKDNNSTINNCFLKAGLLTGYNDVKSHLPPAKFNARVPLRDTTLPQVNTVYINTVLSIENLPRDRDSPVNIPESVITQQQRLLQEIAVSGIGFRKFFVIGIAANMQTDDRNQSSSQVDIQIEKQHFMFSWRQSAKNIQVGKSANIPRDAPGRYKYLLSARDQWEAELRAEINSVENRNAKLMRQEVRQEEHKREKPLADLPIVTNCMAQ